MPRPGNMKGQYDNLISGFCFHFPAKVHKTVIRDPIIDKDLE